MRLVTGGIRWMATVVLAVACSAGTALAAESYWTDSAGGTFDDAANWSTPAVPDGDDNARFTNNASYTVSWDKDAGNLNAYFDAPGNNVTLDIDTYTWTLSDALYVGNDAAAAATVTLDGGTVTATRVVLDDNANTLILNKGTLNTSGNSTIDAGSNIWRIGDPSETSDDGTMTWNISGGNSTVSAPGEQIHVGGQHANHRGVLNVSGGSTRLDIDSSLYIGSHDYDGGRNKAFNCELNVTGGAEVHVTEDLDVGYFGRSNLVYVAGEDSLLSATGSLSFCKNKHQGSYNASRMIVDDGGTIRIGSNSGLGIDMGNDWLIRIDGTNSLLQFDHYVYFTGLNGQCIVTNGGRIYASNPGQFFGFQAAGGGSGCVSNTFTVTGEGSMFETEGSFSFGGETANPCHGNRVHVRDGATFSVTNNSFNPQGSNNVFMVEGAGSRFLCKGINTRASLSFEEPCLIVSNGATVYRYDSQFQGGQLTDTAGEVLVTGAGSVITNEPAASALTLGQASNTIGKLTIRDGGKYYHAGTGQGVYIGNHEYGTGVLTVADPGSLFSSAGTTRFNLGQSGHGTVIVSNGASLRIDCWFNMAYNATSTDNLLVLAGGGSTFDSTSTDDFNVNDGTLRFTSDANGFGQLSFLGDMSIDAANASLEADISGYAEAGYPGRIEEFVLIDYGALDGGNTFSAGNVSVTGGLGGTIDQEAAGGKMVLRVSLPPEGSLFILR